MATESRSQKQNRAAALERLRRRLAFELREPLPKESAPTPSPIAQWLDRKGKLQLSLRDPRYVSVIGIILDTLERTGASASGAAAYLGMTTAGLVRFLQRDEELLAQVNRLRRQNGLRPLGAAQH